jgi:hypothetical protein
MLPACRFHSIATLDGWQLKVEVVSGRESSVQKIAECSNLGVKYNCQKMAMQDVQDELRGAALAACRRLLHRNHHQTIDPSG